MPSFFYYLIIPKDIMLTPAKICEYQNATQQRLNNSLSNACKFNKIELVKFLVESPQLKKHANVKKYGSENLTATHKPQIIKYLLENGADPYKNSEYFFLHIFYCFVISDKQEDKEFIEWLFLEYGLKTTREINKKMKSLETNNNANVILAIATVKELFRKSATINLYRKIDRKVENKENHVYVRNKI